MIVLVADTFTAALARLTADEQKAVKTAAFDLRTDPTRPGLSLRRIDAAEDPNCWSARASRDARLVDRLAAPAPVTAEALGYAHPDARRRFEDIDSAQALDGRARRAP